MYNPSSKAYPWGGYNHALRKQQTSYLSELSPDDKAFSEIASELVSVAGENPSKGIDKYLEGTMNEVVYPVNGGLEDWVYAGGWENNYSGSAQIITPCNVKGQKIQTNSSHIRSVLFLVEAGDPKDPPESSLGKISGLLEKSILFYIN